MKDILKQLKSTLNHLNIERVTAIVYNPTTLDLSLRQLGNIDIKIDFLVGYIEITDNIQILYPEDLADIKAVLEHLESLDSYFTKPIKNGFEFWAMGDLAYTSTPKYLGQLQLSSVYSRFLLWIEKLRNKEVEVLLNTINNK